MKLAGIEVERATKPVTCDTCLRDAVLVVNGQYQCAAHAGDILLNDPEMIGDLVVQILDFEKVAR